MLGASMNTYLAMSHFFFFKKTLICSEGKPCFQATLLDLLDTLHVDIEDTDLALPRHFGHAGPARAVHVPTEHGVLQECPLVHKSLHLHPGREEVKKSRGNADRTHLETK